MSVHASNLASSQALSKIEESWRRFSDTVSKSDARQFQDTELKDVWDTAREVEKQLEAKGDCRALRRIHPFLTGLGTYSEALGVLCNGTPFLPWIWAPIKLFLHITSDYLSAFDKLIKAYAEIGDTLPRFDRLGHALRAQPDFQAVLAVFYCDIVDFHRRAYKLFRTSSWKRFFDSSWSRFDIRFKDLIGDLRYHAELLEKEANAHNIESSTEWRQWHMEEVRKREKERNEDQFHRVLSWLDVKDYIQEDLVDKLAERCHEGTSEWFIEHSKIKSWIGSDAHQPGLWVNGTPGSGKSVLCCSLIRHLESEKKHVVAYYVCHHSSPSLNNCSYVLRAVIGQLLRQAPILIGLVYDEYVTQGVACSKAHLRRLIPVLVSGLTSLRILIDGLDECPDEEQIEILSALRLCTDNPSSTTLCKVAVFSRDIPLISESLRRFAILSLKDDAPAMEPIHGPVHHDMQHIVELENDNVGEQSLRQPQPAERHASAQDREGWNKAQEYGENGASAFDAVQQKWSDDDSVTTHTDNIFSLPSTRSVHESYSQTTVTTHGCSAQEADQSMADSASDISDVTMGLPPADNRYLVELFAAALLAKLDTGENCTWDADQLHMLLRHYSILLRSKVQARSLEAAAASFVNTRRSAIANSVRNSLSADLVQPKTSNIPSLEDKLELLFWSKPTREEDDREDLPPDDVDYSGVSDDIAEPDLHIPHNDVEKAISFLTESDEFLWLLHHIKNATSTTTTGSVFSDIRSKLLSTVRQAQKLDLTLSWPIVQFFEEQFDHPLEVPLQAVVSIVGNGTAIEAMTCGEYVGRMWPFAGDTILSKLTEAVRLHLTEKQGANFFDAAAGNDRVHFKITTTTSSRGSVTASLVTSNRVFLLEAAETLCWLGAVCRESPKPDSVSYCTPSISIGPGRTDVRIDYSCYDPEPGSNTQEQPTSCWKMLFKNPVIASGFPIATREEGLPGLQMSTDMMTTLSKADRAMTFDGTLLVKGFYSMFVPVKKLGKSIVWHYLVNLDRTWMLLNDARERCKDIASISPSDLVGATHLTGWTRCAKIFAGTSHAEYDGIEYTGANNSKSGLALEDVTVNASYSFGFEFGASTKIVPGKKDLRLPLSLHGIYDKKVWAAKGTIVVVYDTKDERAWLLDGATVLLHLTRASLSHDVSYISVLDRPRRLAGALRCPNSGIDGILSAYDALVDETNRKLPLKDIPVQSHGTQINFATDGRHLQEKTWILEDVITDHFQTLEQIIAHQEKMRARPQISLSNITSRTLQGWGFVDLISGKAMIKPRTARLKRSAAAWLEFTQKCDAISILGSGFGELIKPSPLDCKDSPALPCGMDLMAAPLKILQQIAREDGSIEDDFVQLGEGSYWNFPYRTLSCLPCHCLKPHQQLYCGRNPVVELQNAPPSAKLRRRVSKQLTQAASAREDVLRTCSQGAVIFGCLSDWNKATQRPVHVANARSPAVDGDSGYGTMSGEPSISTQSSGESAEQMVE